MWRPDRWSIRLGTVAIALICASVLSCRSDPAPRGTQVATREAVPLADSVKPDSDAAAATRGSRIARGSGDARTDDSLARAGDGAPATDPLASANGDATIAPLAPPGAPASVFPDPNRPIAKIVTDTWSDERTRDDAGEAARVMSLLGVTEGMRVADIGAGSGYYTVRLSRRVGPSGRVIAQDIVPRYLEKLRERLLKEGLSNVTIALGDPHDPRLPLGSIDLALLVHMYHEVEQPYGLLHNLYPALRPGARVAVVDLNRKTSEHGTPPRLLRCELAALGYERVAQHDLARGSGYLAIFVPPASRGELTPPDSVEVCVA